MPYYVNFKLKESGVPVTCQQVDTIIANHFELLSEALDSNKEFDWFFNWYEWFCRRLSMGYTLNEIIDQCSKHEPELKPVYWESSNWNHDFVNYTRIAWILNYLFDISTGYYRK